jgi:hypothetical protein
MLVSDAEQAALLLGAAVTMRGVALVDEHDVAADAERLLGAERYAEAHHQGRELTAEELLSLTGEPQ